MIKKDKDCHKRNSFRRVLINMPFKREVLIEDYTVGNIRIFDHRKKVVESFQIFKNFQLTFEVVEIFDHLLMVVEKKLKLIKIN